MKSYLLLFLIVFTSVSNSLSQPINTVIDGIERPKAIPTKRIVCDYAFVQQNDKQLSFKERLSGVWGSDEYKEILFKTNSLTKTLAEFKFYSDIVFDQDSTLHCNRPDFMEENYFFLINDSSFVNMSDKNDVLTIVSVNLNKLVVRDKNGKDHHFTKMKEQADLEAIFNSILEGSSTIENLWLKGKYVFESKSVNFELTITESGEVISNQNIMKIDVFSYQNEDIMCLRYFNGTYKMYVIKSHSEQGFVLQEMKSLEEENQPIEYLKTGAEMRKKQ